MDRENVGRGLRVAQGTHSHGLSRPDQPATTYTDSIRIPEIIKPHRNTTSALAWDELKTTAPAWLTTHNAGSEPELFATIGGFVGSAALKRGVPPAGKVTP